jgi:hypothetical protein
MTTIPHNDVRPLPHLVFLGAVGVATVGLLLVIAFLWLRHPQPATRSAVAVPVTQNIEEHEVPPSTSSDIPEGSPLGLPADKAAASPTQDAPSNRDVPALRSTAV